MREVCKATLVVLPPSTNKLYINNRWGGRTLSSAAKKFITGAKVALLRQWVFMPEALDPNVAYKLQVTFYMEKVTNKGWPGKAKFKFKKQDVTNYIKLLEDVIAIACGVDDSSFLDVEAKKREDKDNPRIEIIISELSREDYND
jgi:Holliday junction resolvase RusA-like endonuclease